MAFAMSQSLCDCKINKNIDTMLSLNGKMLFLQHN